MRRPRRRPRARTRRCPRPLRPSCALSSTRRSCRHGAAPRTSRAGAPASRGDGTCRRSSGSPCSRAPRGSPGHDSLLSWPVAVRPLIALRSSGPWGCKEFASAGVAPGTGVAWSGPCRSRSWPSWRWRSSTSSPGASMVVRPCGRGGCRQQAASRWRMSSSTFCQS